jgi:RNA polymerase sigma factor (sigma-70 family)
MSTDRIEELLEKLCSGDDDAAEEVFRAYEPYLRKVVRRQLTPALRSRFDSMDVVQSMWADLLSGFRESGWRFESAGQLRAFLVRAIRNRFIDRVRTTRRGLAAEQPLPPQIDLPSSAPAPSAEVRATDLWQRLLERCPEEHRSVLKLKREGRSLAEISERVGLHPDSIRRILRDLSRQVARETAEEPRGGSPAIQG